MPRNDPSGGMMRLLITNDDGIDSAGIKALAHAAAQDHDVVVAAPAWNSSGASASITGVSTDGRLLFKDRTAEFPATVATYAVDSSPAMIVRAAMQGGFGPSPDLGLSGSNGAPNTGHAVRHSGTVGAALTAATHGCRAVAFSLGSGRPAEYGAAAQVARQLIPWAADAPPPLTLNVNVPSCTADELRGVAPAELADFGAVQTRVTERGEGHVTLTFTDIKPSGEPNSDAALLAAGWATVTALRPVCEADDYDLHTLADSVVT